MQSLDEMDRGKELEENADDETMVIVGLHPAKKGIVLNLGKIVLNSRVGGFTLFTRWWFQFF